MSFAAQIHFGLKKNFDDEDFFLRVKDVILKNLLFDILPFRVWNHMWYCSRSYYCSSIFLYCTRVCINHRGVSDLVNNKLYVPAELFPQFVREDIVLMDKICFSVHFHGTFSGKRKKIENNFGALYYERICSPFLLSKTYLEILCRIVDNFVDKKILSMFVNNGFSVCRNKTVCDQR